MARNESLSRDRVVEAARRIALRGGIGELSMRSLADELQVSTMAAYRHVPSKASLIDDLVDSAFNEVKLPCPDLDWQERISQLITRVYFALEPYAGLAAHLTGSMLVRPSVMSVSSALLDAYKEGGVPYEYFQSGGLAAVGIVRSAAAITQSWPEVVHALDDHSEVINERFGAGGAWIQKRREDIDPGRQAESMLKRSIEFHLAALNAIAQRPAASAA